MLNIVVSVKVASAETCGDPSSDTSAGAYTRTVSPASRSSSLKGPSSLPEREVHEPLSMVRVSTHFAWLALSHDSVPPL